MCMKTRSLDLHPARAAFTLLELVVVLAILALVTTMAFRSLEQVKDQRRYEASRQMLTDLEKAVLGDEAIAGFVADMGRLPNTIEAGSVTIEGSPTTTYLKFGLAELSQQLSLPSYDVRTTSVDSEVVLPTGWRGPYLPLPLDQTAQVALPNQAILLDGWDQEMRSINSATPVKATTLGYSRLRDASDAAIITADQPVSIIRHLGANGMHGASDTGVDRDLHISFVGRYQASVTASVEVLENDGSPAPVSSTDQVYVRVFTPNPTDVTQLLVLQQKANQAASVNPPAITSANLTIGQRAVRAYVIQDQGNADPSDDVLIARSTIKYIPLRSGVNFIPLTIYRP